MPDNPAKFCAPTLEKSARVLAKLDFLGAVKTSSCSVFSPTVPIYCPEWSQVYEAFLVVLEYFGGRGLDLASIFGCFGVFWGSWFGVVKTSWVFG